MTDFGRVCPRYAKLQPEFDRLRPLSAGVKFHSVRIRPASAISTGVGPRFAHIMLSYPHSRRHTWQSFHGLCACLGMCGRPIRVQGSRLSISFIQEDRLFSPMYANLEKCSTSGSPSAKVPSLPQPPHYPKGRRAVVQSSIFRSRSGGSAGAPDVPNSFEQGRRPRQRRDQVGAQGQLIRGPDHRGRTEGRLRRGQGRLRQPARHGGASRSCR